LYSHHINGSFNIIDKETNANLCSGLFFTFAEEVMCSMMPLYSAKWMLERHIQTGKYFVDGQKLAIELV
jgi:hypothetical protein